VLEILSHVNKRIKDQKHIALPLDELLQQFKSPDSAAMVSLGRACRLGKGSMLSSGGSCNCTGAALPLPPSIQEAWPGAHPTPMLPQVRNFALVYTEMAFERAAPEAQLAAVGGARHPLRRCRPAGGVAAAWLSRCCRRCGCTCRQGSTGPRAAARCQRLGPARCSCAAWSCHQLRGLAMPSAWSALERSACTPPLAPPCRRARCCRASRPCRRSTSPSACAWRCRAWRTCSSPTR
jgi:hypothetical protein